MGYPSSLLPQDRGRYCSPKDWNEVEPTLRDRARTMCEDSPHRSLILISGHRTPQMQFDLRRQRVPHGHEFDRRYTGHPVTALPYQSKHQGNYPNMRYAWAVDLGGGDLTWADGVCHEYGLGMTVRSEDWHFECEGSPRRPIRSHGGGGGGGGSSAPIVPTAVKPGQHGSKVKLLQNYLNMWLNAIHAHQIGADGNYGPETAACVLLFKQWYMDHNPRGTRGWPRPPDGVAGPKTCVALADAVNFLYNMR